jgi:hypothetical protein
LSGTCQNLLSDLFYGQDGYFGKNAANARHKYTISDLFELRVIHVIATAVSRTGRFQGLFAVVTL